MEKTKIYDDAYFQVDVLKHVLETHFKGDKYRQSFRLRRGNESWQWDDEREFYPDYRKDHDSSTLRRSVDESSLTVEYTAGKNTTVTVLAQTRADVEGIFDIFEDKYTSSIVPRQPEKKSEIIFIGHGRSQQWRDLKDHLSDQHGYKIEAYETGARAGHTIRDVLEDMASKSSFAILVMTGEDEDREGNKKARPNVIHEIGLFQGRLGFSKAIVLLEEGTEEFSNLFGIQQLRYKKGNIREVFGDVLATLKRELL